MAKKKMGGKREGAGRKPLGKVQVTLTLSPEANQALSEQARQEALTRSDYAEQAIVEMAGINRTKLTELSKRRKKSTGS